MLHKNIRDRRTLLGITQLELAQKLGYKSVSTIAKIEAGVIDIPQSKIIAFANALDTTPGELMGLTARDTRLEPAVARTIAQLLRQENSDVKDIKIKIIKDVVETNLTIEQLNALSVFLKTFK